MLPGSILDMFTTNKGHITLNNSGNHFFLVLQKKMTRTEIEKYIAKFVKNYLHNEQGSSIVGILGEVNRNDHENDKFFPSQNDKKLPFYLLIEKFMNSICILLKGKRKMFLLIFSIV